MNKWMWIIIAALAFQGCKLGVDQEDDGEIEDVVIDSSTDTSAVVDEDETYNLIVTGTNNIITLKGDVSEINIKGTGNDLIIDSDLLIDKVTISTDSNTIVVSGALETVITQLLITGSSNAIEVYDVGTSTDTGELNNITETIQN